MSNSENPAFDTPAKGVSAATAELVVKRVPTQLVLDLWEQLPSIQRLLTKLEIAAYCGVVPRTIDQWMATGKIPFRKIGRTVRFSLAEVNEFHRQNFLVTWRSAGGNP